VFKLLFNFVDWLFVGVIAVSAIVSLLRGFVREALSLCTWITAGIVAWYFAADIADQLAALDIQLFAIYHTRIVAACILLFVISLMIGSLVNYLIYRVINLSSAGVMDKLLGMVFGIARGMILVLFVVGIINLTVLQEADWWQRSVLQPEFTKVAIWAQKYVTDLSS